ncbi:sugar transporter [Burkholderia sp. WAC0059]|uniref:GNVR domain-containing protein n=1 Tax=Burkholderia sp. WAC0059 TaxID=2066022 RepID=UPI000C7EE955|nr:GNVR domain-containing protein [Burkholderia sp. WAC0059]PLZ03571.1 sugar transporter [Burkholderia sp. WAC0059]
MTSRDMTLQTIDADFAEAGQGGNYLDMLYQNRKWIAAITACFALAGGAYALLAQPVYQSDILIQVEENQSSPRNVLSDLSSMFAVKTEASSEIEVLRSRMVISRAVDSIKLYIHATPRYFPVIGKWFADHLGTPAWSGFGGYAWGGEKIAVETFEVPDELYGAPFRLTLLGGGRYRLSHGHAEFEGKVGQPLHAAAGSGYVDLLVSEATGKPGASFELERDSRLSAIEALQAGLLITEKGKDSDVIGVALQGTDPRRIRDILNAIGNEYVQQNVQRTAEEAEKSILFLQKQLPELKTQLETAESNFNAFRAANGTVDLNAEADALLQRAANTQTRVSDLKQQRAQLLERFTPEHPAVKAVDDQLAEADQEVSDIAAATRALPPLEQNLLQLQREVQVDTDLYTNLLNTQEQLRLLKAGKVGNVRLVDSAFVPESRLRPKRAFVIAGALLTGLFLSVSVVLLKRRLVDGIGEAAEIEAGTGLLVYASVPRSRAQVLLTRKLTGNTSADLVLARVASGDAAVESLRSFRNALEFALREAPNRIVLLAGPTPVVGKSFVSVNLAALMGASGQRVLLVDADLRRGSIHRYLGIPAGRGVPDIVVDGLPLEEVVCRDVLPGVDLVTSGSNVRNPGEILMHENFVAFMRHAQETYDLVLIDAPPILPVADSGIVARLAGTVFMIARHGVTHLDEMRDAMRRFAQIGVPIRGVIFNDLKSRPGKYGREYGYDG